MSKKRLVEMMQKASGLLSKGRADEALPILIRAYQLAPSNPDIALNLGGAYIMLHQYDEAIPILEKTAELIPDDSKIWINLGAAYLGKLEEASEENQQQAIEAFEKALELDPAAPSVNYNIGLIHRERGALDLAFKHFKRAKAINPLDRDAECILEKLRNALEHSTSEEE
jgi:tetratricopeptide (TPR) repeat protein